MKETHYKKLLQKYLNNELNADELADFLAQTEANENVFLEETENIDPNQLQSGFNGGQVFQNIINHPEFAGQEQKVRKFSLSPLFRIAASLLAFGAFSLIAYHYIYPSFLHKENYTTNVVTKDNVLLSGKESVLMELADGTTMKLEEETLQQAIERDGMIVRKNKNGEVVLSLTAGSSRSGNHVFTTPKGESFAFELPDGSKVWLNSSTRISIPTNFNASTRDVYLDGEAFFDVAHNTQKPFKIHTGKDKIQVLGTAFNVKAYSQDKQIYTTLIRGSVKVSVAHENVLLRPGEQSFSDQVTGSLNKKEVDVDQFIGWKTGYFKFVDEPVQGILNELMKWYDIRDVSYQTKNAERFTASIKRSRSLAEVLENIEKVSDLKFSTEEGRIVVKDK